MKLDSFENNFDDLIAKKETTWTKLLEQLNGLYKLPFYENLIVKDKSMIIQLLFSVIFFCITVYENSEDIAMSSKSDNVYSNTGQKVQNKEERGYKVLKKENMIFKCRTRTFLILFDALYTVHNF